MQSEKPPTYLCAVESCADPECLVRGGPALTTFFHFLLFTSWWVGEDPNPTKSAIIGPPGKHHLNGVSLAC